MNSQLQQQRYIFGALLLVATLAIAGCRAQDDDYEGYGPQGGGGANSGAGGANQNDNEGYQNGYGNEEGNYNGNMPNGYQQNVDPESSNNQPSSYSPQGNSDADADYDGEDGNAAAASSVQPTIIKRMRRSLDTQAEASAPKLRVKRHGKYYIGPVYTYVKTDKHANFKWGVSTRVMFIFTISCLLESVTILILIFLNFSTSH